MCIFRFCLFVGQTQRAKMKKMKRKIKKISVFGWLWRKRCFLLKWLFLGEKKKANAICIRKVQSSAFSFQLSVFRDWSFFVAHSKSPKSAGTRETQNGTFGCKSAILGRGLERGLYYLWYLKAVLCWKHIFRVLAPKHSFADMRECNLNKKKQKFTKNKGLFAKMQKVFFWSVFCFLVFFFFLCVFVLVFCKKAHKVFSCNFRGFKICSPKGLSLKSFFSSYSVFFLGFPVSSLSEIHFFFAFCPSTSFFQNIIIFGFFCFSYFCLFLS